MAFSEFKVAEKFARKHPGFEGMLNVVEDALVERRAMQRWPGVRANLDAMFAQVRDRIAALIAQRGPFERFCTAVYLKLAHHGDMMGLDAELAGYEDLLDRFPAIHSTRDAAGLAETLLDRWLSKHPYKANARNQGGGTGASPSQPAPKDQGHPSGGGDTSGQHKDDRQPQPKGENGGQPDGSSEPAPSKGASRRRSRRRKVGVGTDQKADGMPVGAQTVSPNGGSLISQAVAEAIAECVSRARNSTDYRVFTKQYDQIVTLSSAGDTETLALLAAGVDVVRRLRRGLANALRSAEKRWWRDDQVRGVLSPKTLYRLCTDRTQLDVFRVRSVVQGRSTAVSVVLDASGSMTSHKMDVARQAMRVLLEALADLKIATEAFTFTTGERFSLDDACRVTGREYTDLRARFSRFGNLEIGLIKRFEEPVKSALRRLPTICGTGLTPLGEAMQIGAARLVRRRENRKIMLVLTDGRAGCECGDGAAVAHAQYIANLCRRAGIELIGVGILDDSLCAIVADTIVIHRLNDLPAQLCKLLGRTLKRGVCHAG